MATWIERLTKPSPTNEPPAKSELRRNDLLVAAIVLFALFLAFGIRNQVLNASESVRLGENLPRIAYPARWRVQNSDGALLHAINAGSPSGLTRSCWLPAVHCAAMKRWRMPAAIAGSSSLQA